MKKRSLLIIGMGLFLVPMSNRGLANDFYQGKTIRLIVGYAAGGSYDTYTRAITRHMGKHIPGNPSMVVENMPGAGSLVLANYMSNKAAPDGLTVGSGTASLSYSMPSATGMSGLTRATWNGSARLAPALPHA
jgi:tripartite-type tricarboxylate transporter receptor subunit TctC